MSKTPNNSAPSRRRMLQIAGAAATGVAAFPYVQAQEKITLRYLGTAVNQDKTIAEKFEKDTGITVHDEHRGGIAHAATLGYRFVHQWLGVTRVIAFVVSVAAIANEVDDHVFMELLAIVECQTSNAHARFWVVCVHMENWRLHRFCNIAWILR